MRLLTSVLQSLWFDFSQIADCFHAIRPSSKLCRRSTASKSCSLCLLICPELKIEEKIGWNDCVAMCHCASVAGCPIRIFWQHWSFYYGSTTWPMHPHIPSPCTAVGCADRVRKTAGHCASQRGLRQTLLQAARLRVRQRSGRASCTRISRRHRPSTGQALPEGLPCRGAPPRPPASPTPRALRAVCL